MTAESTRIWRCPSCNRLLVEKGVDYARARLGRVRARSDLARVPRLAQALPLWEPARVKGGAVRGGPRAARSADRRGGAAMSALVFVGMVAVLAWSLARESARRRRWREAERLSRCLFAMAGMRRYR